jgi:hypothetical protein
LLYCRAIAYVAFKACHTREQIVDRFVDCRERVSGAACGDRVRLLEFG